MTDQTGEIRPFFECLRELRSGRALDELAHRLNEVVAAVREHGGAGELRLTLKIRPASKGDPSALLVIDVVKTKIPEREASATVFFPDADNNLMRSNPKQPELELRPVSSPAASQFHQ